MLFEVNNQDLLDSPLDEKEMMKVSFSRPYSMYLNFYYGRAGM